MRDSRPDGPKHSLLRIFRHSTLLIAGAAAYSMSTLFSAMKPVLLTRFVEQTGISESLAGMIVALPFVGIAVASVLGRLLPDTLSIRVLGMVFGGLLVLVELLSAVTFESAGLTLVLQLLGGISVGILMGATSREISMTELPDESFGFVDMMAVFLMSFMIAGVGMAVGRYGIEGGYLFAAATSLLFTVLVVQYRQVSMCREEVQGSPAPLVLSIRPVAVVLMGVLFVTTSGLGFAFLFTLARDLGMDYEFAGSVIGTLVFVSAIACQFGGWCSGRYGPLRPLACAYVACALGWYLAIHASSPVIYILALIPAIFSLQFNFPILLALSGSLDEQGRWAQIATPLLTSGFAWAAIAAGAIVEHWGIQELSRATTLGMIVCLGLLLLAREPARPVVAAEQVR